MIHLRLLLLLVLLALSVSHTASLFPFHVQTLRAPWPVRIQPAWQTITRTIRTGDAGDFGPGSMILYGGIGSNDIWITKPGNNVGKYWTLIGGVVRDPYLPQNGSYVETTRAPPPFDLTSFPERYTPAVCEDPSNDDAYIISGQIRDQWLQDVWRTDDGREWYSMGDGEFEPRVLASCTVGTDGAITLMGGMSRPYAGKNGVISEPLNDVWRSTDRGLNWRSVTGTAPWKARWEFLAFANRMPLRSDRDILYVLGGGVDELTTEFLNDVWASSDDGLTWTMLCAAAPWPPRWGHSGVITSDGIIVFYGGAVRDDYYDAYQGNNYLFYGDVWSSFDGGLLWSECTAGYSPYNRTEAAVSLDVDGFFMMAAGYSLASRGRHDRPVVQWNSEVVRSDFSLQQDAEGRKDNGRQLAEMCAVEYPSSGTGLRGWPQQQWNQQAGAITGVVCISVFIALVAAGYLFLKHNVQQQSAVPGHRIAWPSAMEIKKKAVQAVSMPDLSFLTNLPLAEQYRQQLQHEGQSSSQPSNNLSEGLLNDQQESTRSEGASA